MCNYYNSSFLKKDRSYRNNTDTDCMMIPDTALEILKMLIRVCFRDLLLPAAY